VSLQTNVTEQQLLADSFRRADSRMNQRELAAELGAAIGFVVAVGAALAVEPPHGLAIGPAILCWFVLVAATLVRFETPFGFTVPIQLAFVPLLFTVPVALVPVAVSLALVAARLRDVFRGQVDPRRLLRAAGVNGWFALGPVAVFALSHTDPRHAGPLILLAALVAQFGIDFAISGLLLAVERSTGVAVQLRDSAWVYCVDAALSGIGLVVAREMHSSALTVLALLPLLGLLAVFARERHHRLQSLLELNTAYRGTALVLGEVVEADDGYTGEHCKSVVRLCIEVCDRLGLDAERQRNLEFGALLHDVGKIAIPKEIINKPGKLDPEEWLIIKTHTIEGQKMLDVVGGFMRDVGRIVRSHHERWDGTGYPDGLSGEAIPLESRIISCCDTWNAMRTDRAYRKALSFEVAMEELLRCAGTQLDPHVVQALIEVVEADRLLSAFPGEHKGMAAARASAVPAPAQ
jgi:putative nucleotidyltransferase with HDIG domain